MRGCLSVFLIASILGGLPALMLACAGETEAIEVEVTR